MIFRSFRAIVFATLLCAPCAAFAEPPVTDEILTPHPTPAEKFGNVFSIAHSIRGDGFDEIVRRNGGTAVYQFLGADKEMLRFGADIRYDGQPPVKGAQDAVSRDGMRDCFQDQCRTYTDSSGLLYNQLFWGKPSEKLEKGATWNVNIQEPWEIGPPATQKITVLAVDRAAHTATLMREGSGTGQYANAKAQIEITRAGKIYQVGVTPGPAHWQGFTTFRDGFVQADELVMEREIALSSPELGELHATERFCMLLNAMPVDG